MGMAERTVNLQMKCKACEGEIKTRGVLACTCGSFCSEECITKYHEGVSWYLHAKSR